MQIKLKTILSTKVLNSNQVNELLTNNFNLIEFNFITIDLLKLREKIDNTNIIITSKNAIFSLNELNKKEISIFCVGSLTRNILLKEGFNVVAHAENAIELSKIIIKNYNNLKFSYLCSSIRRNDLPNALLNHSIDCNEIMVYKTTLNSIKINEKVDIILFYSPSGVQSYCLENQINNEICYCIGKTTALELKKHTSNYIVVSKSSIEFMVSEIIKNN